MASAESSIEVAPKRVVGRPFPKGVSGNPGGRPKGLAARIRQATNDGEDLVAFMVRVLHDEHEKTADRITAATWLADRAFGRPALTIEARPGVDEGVEAWRETIRSLPPEERRELHRRVVERLQQLERFEQAEAVALPAATAGEG